jgi:hypothetical protein
MSFKEELKKEQLDLQNSKRPYETAAFLVFAVMFLQQMAFLIYRFWNFVKASKGAATGWFSTASMTTPPLFSRVVSLDNSKYLYVYLAILALALWYFLIYLFVWRYCKRRGLAKWTWTLLVVFGPTILLMPPYIFYAIYVFRPYFFRFIKTVIEEYKAYDPKIPFPEEMEEEKVESVKEAPKKAQPKKEVPKEEPVPELEPESK